jgi:hypothetical protein
MEREKSLEKRVSPSKTVPFQAIKRPPEAPIEGRKSKLLILLGQKFFRYL